MKLFLAAAAALLIALPASAKDRVSFRRVDKDKPEQKPVEGSVEKEDWKEVTIKIEGAATGTYAWDKVADVEYGDEPGALRDAKAEKEKGNLEGAAAGFLKAAEGLKDKPIFLAHALMGAGRCFQALRKFDEAIKAYDDLAKAVAGNRFFREMHDSKVACYLEKNDLAGATTAIEAAEKAGKELSVDPPFDLQMKLKKAEIVERQGNDAQASGQFQAVAAGASRYPAIAGLAKLGQARVQLKTNATAAQGVYESITREFKGQRAVLGPAWVGLGDCLMAQAEKDIDKLKSAARAYEMAVVLYFPGEGQSTSAYEKALTAGGQAYLALAQKAGNDKAKELYATQARSMALTLLDQFPASSQKASATDVRNKADELLPKGGK